MKQNNKIGLSIGIVFGIIILALVFVLVIKNNQPQLATPQVITPTSNSTTQQEHTPPSAVIGTYEPYSQAALQAAKDKRKLLFFHAAWCPQCRALEKSIEQSGVPVGVAIFKVDFDNSHELRQKYDVTIQTTIVEIDEQGNLLKKHVAYDNPVLPEVMQALNK